MCKRVWWFGSQDDEFMVWAQNYRWSVFQFGLQNRFVSSLRRPVLDHWMCGTMVNPASRRSEVVKAPGPSDVLRKTWKVLPLRGIWVVCLM